MFKILTLNNISVAGLDRLPRDKYEIASEISHPDAILLRSYKMHDMEIPETVKAIGRAGAGVNNIPVDKMTAAGVPVFNAPGANSNAVKELVLAGMLMAARNIGQAWDFAKNLEGEDGAINKDVEQGKKNYVGFELPGRTLGVVGLGAIGVRVTDLGVDPSSRMVDVLVVFLIIVAVAGPLLFARPWVKSIGTWIIIGADSQWTINQGLRYVFRRTNNYSRCTIGCRIS